MPISFSITSGRAHDPVTITATALTASTVYIATFTSGQGKGTREFTTDASGNATFDYTAGGARNTVTLTASPKVTAPAVTSTNTYTVV